MAFAVHNVFVSCSVLLLCFSHRASRHTTDPVLAWILTPNIYLNFTFGKILFILCDVLTGLLIYQYLCLRGISSEVRLNKSCSDNDTSIRNY